MLGWCPKYKHAVPPLNNCVNNRSSFAFDMNGYLEKKSLLNMDDAPRNVCIDGLSAKTSGAKPPPSGVSATAAGGIQ